ncbi:unnamed protein product [Blepharisma stoltei]|uniref:protein disulfide-isomerase n=1 Tax=Blepharisma stoltei TaxID=1481888 RepID=A0AAU9J5S8_9CILI|nr:unnamed protein product [Blepharisma stoltei]
MLKHVSLLLLLGLAFCHDEPKNILKLTDDTFEEVLSTNPYVFVEFYSPWCAHCRYFDPLYSKVSTLFSENTPQVIISKIDATVHLEAAENYDISAYPTFKLFINKEPIDYTGPRSENGMINWIFKKINPPAWHLQSLDTVKAFLEDNKLAFVLFTTHGSAEEKIFEETAKTLEGSYYAISTDPEAAKEYGVNIPQLVVFKHYDDGKAEYKGEFNESDLTEFIEKHQLPWVMRFEGKAIEYVFGKENPCLFLFRKEEDSQYDELLQHISKHVKGEIFMTYADLWDSINIRLGNSIGVSPDSMPMAFIWHSETKKYMLSGEITEETLLQFLQDYKKGILPIYYKSEPVPEKDYDDNIKILVASTFEDIVYNSSLNVLVQFHAPWCGHCRTLTPEFKKVAERFSGTESIAVAMLDATKNEIPGHEITKFPTIKYFTTENKEGIEYNGSRDAESIIEFIKNNTPTQKQMKHDL